MKRVIPAPGPFVHLRLVDSWDGPMPIYKTFLLSNDDAVKLSQELLEAVDYSESPKDRSAEVHTPFHGKPSEPIVFRESPKV